MPRRHVFRDVERDRYVETAHIHYTEHGDPSSCSNFVDLDWLSSSANSCEEETYERWILGYPNLNSGLNTEYVALQKLNYLLYYVVASRARKGWGQGGWEGSILRVNLCWVTCSIHLPLLTAHFCFHYWFCLKLFIPLEDLWRSLLHDDEADGSI